MPITLQRRALLAAGAFAMLAPGLAPLDAIAADAYPTKPITIVVNYAPGGQGDVFARLIAERLTASWRQPVIVDNKPGASGAIGARLVARAPADGYTLMLAQTGEMVINRAAMARPGYDGLRDFKPIVLVGDSPLVVVTAANSPYATIKDLVSASRAAPGKLSYASSGTATPGHLAAAAFDVAMKTDAVHVAYKGAGPAMTDVLGGQVAYFFSSLSAAMPHIKAGKLRALAVTSAERVPSLPQVPTVAESGAPGFTFSLWGALFAPAQTPADVVQEINREVNRIISEPAMRSRLEEQGAIVRTNRPEELAEFMRVEGAKYEQIIKRTGVTTE